MEKFSYDPFPEEGRFDHLGPTWIYPPSYKPHLMEGPRAQRNEARWAAVFAFRVECLPLVHAWREAAVADGWQVDRTYDHEPIEHAAKLRRDGWVAHTLSRPCENAAGRLYKPEIHVWAPDRKAVQVPQVYSFSALLAGARRCEVCRAEDVETVGVAFANRCCAACAPGLRKVLERPGWCD